MSLFPDNLGASARSAAGLLFRVETAANSVRVLLQSSIQPDLSRVPPRYGYAETAQLDSFLQMLTNGMTVRYRITANPSKQLPRGHPGPGRPGQRIALRGAQAEAWWRKRADHAGLTLTNVVMLPRQDLVGQQTGQISKASQKEIRHAAAQYDGTATIQDVRTIRDAISKGIGRGKPYGCWSPGNFVDISIMLLLVSNCQIGARNPLGLSCRAGVVSGRDCNIARCSRTRRS